MNKAECEQFGINPACLSCPRMNEKITTVSQLQLRRMIAQNEVSRIATMNSVNDPKALLAGETEIELLADFGNSLMGYAALELDDATSLIDQELAEMKATSNTCADGPIHGFIGNDRSKYEVVICADTNKTTAPLEEGGMCRFDINGQMDAYIIKDERE
jgi:hypothetical protein